MKTLLLALRLAVGLSAISPSVAFSQWTYTAAGANEVRQLLGSGQVGTWECGTGQAGNLTGFVEPQVSFHSTSTKDPHIVAAVMFAWSAECYARHFGRTGEVAYRKLSNDYANRMLDELTEASKYCSGTSDPSDQAATSKIWPCSSVASTQRNPTTSDAGGVTSSSTSGGGTSNGSTAGTSTATSTNGVDGMIEEARRRREQAIAAGDTRTADINNVIGAGLQAGKLLHSMFGHHRTPAEEALLASEKLCNAGNADGCVQLANSYYLGNGTKQDHAKALELYSKGCHGGNAAACRGAGNMVFTGDGAAQDNGTALSFFDMACQGADAAGCFFEGSIYWQGLGVSPDYARSFKLYETACSGSIAEACASVGSQYYLGQGVSLDDTAARQFFERGCTLGSDNGCSWLAYIYQKGSGVPADAARALGLYDRSCAHGFKPACTNAQRLRGH